MNWETIKNKAIREIITKYRTMTNADTIGLLGIESLKQIKSGTFKGTFKLIKETEDKIVNLINNTDIRAYKDLLAVCPEVFPKWIKDGKFTIEYGDSGFEFVRTNKCETCEQYC